MNSVQSKPKPLTSNGTKASLIASTSNNGIKSDPVIPIKKFQGHRNKVRALAWNCDGKRLASGGLDSSVRLWQPERDNKTNIEMKGHSGDISCIKWDPTHPEHLASCSATAGMTPDKSVYFWDLRVSGPTGKVETKGDTINMSWSPDGKIIVLGSRTDVVTWIDATTRKVIKSFKAPYETNESCFSNNGNLLLTAREGRINFQTFPSGTTVTEISVSPCSTSTIDLDSKGKYMVCGSNDTLVTLWETEEWTCLASAGFHGGPVRGIRFSHDGLHVASHTDHTDIIISETPTLKKKYTISAGGSCSAIAWHPTKDWLAFAADEVENGRASGTFKIWGM